MSNLSIGRLVVGTKGSVKNRKGYICHVENPSSASGYVDARVWLMMDNGEVVTGVPEGAFVGRRGRPHNVHSIVAQRRSVYVAHEPLAPLTGAWAELFGTCTEEELTVRDVLVGSHAVMKTTVTEDTVFLAERDEDGITQEQYDTVNEETAQAEASSCPECGSPSSGGSPGERVGNCGCLEQECVCLDQENYTPPVSKPKLPLVGKDGNAFFLIAMAMNAGKKAGWTQAQLDAFRTEITSGDYSNVLKTLGKHFDIMGEEVEEEEEYED